MTALTIVTATCGRASLADTALSVLDQMAEGDEWLVVGDGPQPAAALYADQWPGVRYLETAPTANYGNSQREMGAQQAANGHVLFVDDDDVLVDGALAIIRQAVAAQPRAVHIFRNHYQDHRSVKDQVLWREQVVRCGNVGTGMAVVPTADLHASWVWPLPMAYEADFHFINQAVGQFGVAWHEEVTQIISPHRTSEPQPTSTP